MYRDFVGNYAFCDILLVNWIKIFVYVRVNINRKARFYAFFLLFLSLISYVHNDIYERISEV